MIRTESLMIVSVPWETIFSTAPTSLDRRDMMSPVEVDSK